MDATMVRAGPTAVADRMTAGASTPVWSYTLFARNVLYAQIAVYGRSFMIPLHVARMVRQSASVLSRTGRMPNEGEN